MYMDALESLEHMPDRNPVSGLEILNERQLRLIGIGNYVAIYRVFDDEGIVEVYRVLYGKMDLERRLDEKE
jgi:plasmid stabilization system protein ParE